MFIENEFESRLWLPEWELIDELRKCIDMWVEDTKLLFDKYSDDICPSYWVAT